MTQVGFSHTLCPHHVENSSWRSLFFLGWILTFGTVLIGQVQELGAPIINNYEPAQYKASSQNWVAVQDRRGVMYFGNSNGILEFDSQSWRLIPTQGNATIRALTCGADGTIYYGSIGDFGYLTVLPGGKVCAVSLREAIPEAERSFNDVWQVECSADGIFFLTRSRIFRLHDGRITALPGKFASSQACVLDGTLFYADLEKGICLVEGDRVLPIPQLAGVYNGKRITLAPFDYHQLLVGRMTGDFRRIDLSALWDEASQHYATNRAAPEDMIQAFPSELDAYLKESNSSLYKLVPLGPNAFAISTVKSGIIIFDRAGKIIRAINKNDGLLDNTVLGLLVDSSNDLWAVNNLGISHIELSVPQSVFGAPSGIDGVSNSACFHNNRLYVGTFQNLLVQVPHRFSLKDDTPEYVAVKDSPNEVWQLQEAEGDLMAASGLGLFRIQGERAFKVPGSPTFCLCLGISRRWSGHLFVGLIGGLEVFKRMLGRWALVGRMDGIEENIRRITADANGDLWLSTDGKGLLRVHFSGAKPTEAAVHRFGPENGLPGLTGLRTAFYGTTLYVLSPQGLFRTDIQPWQAEVPDRTHFVPDLVLGKAFSDPPMALNDMASDGQGGFVFSTFEGTTWVFPGKGGQFQMTARPFQGLMSPDDVIYVDPNGYIWLLGRATHRVNPRSPKDYDQPFTILVRNVIAKPGQLVFAGTHGHPGSTFGEQITVFDGGQDPMEIPELPFRQKALSFEFAATFYEKPGSMQFQYLLEGFDREWSDWTGETRKEYSYLPEGSYRFHVRAKNIYGTLGREAVYSLRILPPWYRTWWAYGLWMIGGLATLFGIIYLYTLKLQRQKTHLENIVAERTRELEKLSIVARETDNAIMIMDKKANIEWINPGFTHLYGLTLEELFQEKGSNLITASFNPDIKHVFEKCIGEKKSVSYETSFETKWGKKIFSQTTLTPILDEKGNVKKLITIDSDITGRKLAEEKIKNLLAEKELILKEVHHRIKNNMATVTGMFHLQASTLKSADAIAALKDASSRVQSMVVLYDKLYQSVGFDEVMAKNYLKSLVEEIVANFPDRTKVKVVTHIADFVLNARKLQPLGIIINELLTNIMKYAFTDRSDGSIMVSAEAKDNRVILAISDNGIGMPETVDFENSAGFGLKLVRMLTKQIDGTIRIEHGNGTRIILEFEK
ncbi:MAG: PAS domain S-box protein [Candidatus Aminicenantes bacterium]|nr:PAS domain S-box protein [Candidatus Aminicenantes bacterium]